ncbi:DUF2277 domain-containing protein, partial [Streptomyces sp. NPDC054933]
MCRSIKTLRPPVMEQVGDEDIRAAALQYVRKVSGFRAPAAHNQAAFDRAVGGGGGAPPPPPRGGGGGGGRGGGRPRARARV